MKLSKIFAFSFLLPIALYGQKLNESEREILMLQDQRSLGSGKLLAYLSNSQAELRSRALIALANIQDTASASAVSRLLHDSNASVRATAAFALGQIGTGSVQDSLLGSLGQEKDSTVLARVFEALGRIGNEGALSQVVEFANGDSSAFLAGEQALALTRFALRGFKNEQSIWFCFELTKSLDPEVRWKAFVALWRSAPHGLIDVEIAKRDSELVALVRDPSADVRMNLATLLGRSTSSYAKDLIRSFVEAESKQPNWQVQVQLVKSLGAMATTHPEFIDGVTDFLKSSSDHVKVAALQVVAAFSRQSIVASADTGRLRQALVDLATTKNPAAELTRGEAFVALAKLFPSEFGRLGLNADKDLSVRERTKVIEALSYVPSGRSLSILFYSLDDANVRIAMAAWDFVRRFFTPTTIARIRSGGEEWGDARATLFRKTMHALGRQDMAITHLVSNALADTLFFNIMKERGYADSLVLALKSAYEQLASPDDVEAMQSAVTAMGRIGDQRFVPVLEKALGDPDKTVAAGAAASLFRITRTDYSSKIPQSSKPLYSDYDWSTLESIGPASRAVLKTSKGVVILQLLREDAPFTVLNFVKLVKKGFYNGLSFHRVVPNFVVQGGDPRGDGWGGPGYAIRSEYSFKRFSQGMVGIASAGKDTEGCQFFITHLPTPHLDGRFTVFAKVIEGQDVANQLQVGDTIERITIE